MEPKTVRQIAILSANAMLTTSRVGDPDEDESMASVRNVLSKINSLGFVTIDSQMGHASDGHMQRAYVLGFMANKMVPSFIDRVLLDDDLLCLSFPHGEKCPPGYNSYGLKTMPRLALTLEGNPLKPVTQQPIGAAMSWGEAWSNLLPELGLRNNYSARAAVMKDAAIVFVADMKWGRPKWLFGHIVKRLREGRTVA